MRRARRISAELAAPFLTRGRPDWPVILVFLAINGLVLVNAVLHDPRIGYDSDAHLKNIQVLSELRLVEPKDSPAFYYSPMPYLLPALFMHVTGVQLFWGAKLAQLVNALLSVGVTFFLLGSCRLVNPRPALRLGSLILLGVIPAYYKSFAFVRGEPYLAFFAAATLYFAVDVFVRRRLAIRNALAFGLALGLSGLSRQWGVLLLPAFGAFGVLVWILEVRRRRAVAKALATSLVIGALVGLSFYALQSQRFGSMAAFNRRPAPCFAFRNQPADFYLGLGLDALFTNPVRPSFPNQLWPIFYSELWGDYWGHYAVFGIDTRLPGFVRIRYFTQQLNAGSQPEWLVTNYVTIGPYLGRVNLVALIPTALLAAGTALALARTVSPRAEVRRRKVSAFILLAIAATWAGYMWFLIMYPSIGRGDTIKATYMLHLYPYVALLGGMLIERIQRRMPFVYGFTIALLLLVAAHNLPVMLTQSSLHRLLPIEAAPG